MKNNKQASHIRLFNKIAWGTEPSAEQEVRRSRWMNRATLVLIGTLLILLILVLTGCRTKYVDRPYPVEKIKTVTVVQYDTVLVATLEPQPDQQQVVPADSASHLENDYAESDASVIDGRLNHSLRQKPDAQALARVKVETVYVTDSIPYPVPGPTEYKEFEPNAMQKTLMWAGGIAIVLLVLVSFRRLK